MKEYWPIAGYVITMLGLVGLATTIDNPKQHSHLRHFSGYASVFNNPNSKHGVTIKGAFVKTLAQHKHDAIILNQAGIGVPFLWQHDSTAPIGYITAAHEDSYGLYIEGVIDTNIGQGAEAVTLLRDGVINAVSIGFWSIKTSKEGCEDNKQSVMIGDKAECSPLRNEEEQEVKLQEISLVTVPADNLARIKLDDGK